MSAFGRVALALSFGIPTICFSLRYGERAGIPWAVDLLGALVLVAAVVVLDVLASKSWARDLRLWRLGWLGVGAVVLVEFAVMLRVDRASVDVDRWSQLHFFWDALLRGEYPYLPRTQLGHPFTPQPALELLAAPFVAMGEVGILQPVVFVGLAIWARVRRASPLWLLIIPLGPFIWWEVAARSDLVSNMFIGAAVVVFAMRPSSRPWVVGIVFGLLMSTRLAFGVPILLCLLTYRPRRAVVAACTAAATWAITYLPFVAVWGWSTVRHDNPVSVQNSIAPKPVVYAAIVVALIVGTRLRNAEQVLLVSGLLILFVAMGALIDNIDQYDFHTSILKTGFDLSYLSMAFPFVWVARSLARAREPGPPPEPIPTAAEPAPALERPSATLPPT